MRHARLVYFVAAVLGAGLEASPILAQDAERQIVQGKAIYARRCAKCHGANGEGKMGPSLIGAKHHLSGYGTADVLFDYTRQVMPADRPGRMQEVEYWAVLAYLLKQNGLLPPGTVLESATAPQIPLDRDGPS
jgi:S-disulfanyl-L-cysteine oxidoreductase SoxD